MKISAVDSGVSIRSPHRSEGRLSSLTPEEAAYFEFQSAPPTEVRGDPFYGDSIGFLQRVSIRSPHRSEGRSPVDLKDAHGLSDVSIRSPHRSEGRWTVSAIRGLFQSAPPTEVRGDAGCYNQHKNINLDNRMRDSIKKTSRIADPPVDKLDNLLSDKRFPFARTDRQISVT